MGSSSTRRTKRYNSSCYTALYCIACSLVLSRGKQHTLKGGLISFDPKLLLVFRTGGFAVGRYVPVIASLPDGKDPKEAIREATKVSYTEHEERASNHAFECQGADRRLGSH